MVPTIGVALALSVSVQISYSTEWAITPFTLIPPSSLPKLPPASEAIRGVTKNIERDIDLFKGILDDLRTDPAASKSDIERIQRIINNLESMNRKK